MPRTKTGSTYPSRRRAPAMTAEEREDQLIAMATDLAERKIADGTASNQLIVHYLKLGSTRERLEKERLRQENELLKAKTASIQSNDRIEAMYTAAMDSMRLYSGNASSNNNEEDY